MDYAKELEKAKQEKAMAEGRMAAAKARLLEQFGVESIEQGEALLQQKYEEEKAITEKLEKLRNEFNDKYGDRLKALGLA